MRELKFKDVGLSVKDVDTVQGVVTGFFSKFNNKDSDGDIVMPGAFTKTIKENGPESIKPRILHLLQHDPLKPLAKPKVLQETEEGLYFESQISHTSYGRDAIQLYYDGVITEHSIGYQVIKSEETRDANKLIELKLWEGSTVSWGANMDALVTSVKTETPTKDIYDKLIKKLEALNVAVKGNYTDDTARQLELQLLQIQHIIKALAERMEPEHTPEVRKPSLTVDEAVKILTNKLI